MADDDVTEETDEGTEEQNDQEEEVFTAKDRDKLREALRKERAEKKALEKYLTPEERRAAKNPKPSDMPGAKKSSDDSGTEKDTRGDVEAQIKKARDETEDKFRPLIAKSAARAALASSGATGDLRKMVRMLDLGDLDISDDGEVDGLDEQIEDLKKDFPALFRSDDKDSEDDLKVRRRRGSADGGPRKSAVRKSASEIQAKALGY